MVNNGMIHDMAIHGCQLGNVEIIVDSSLHCLEREFAWIIDAEPQTITKNREQELMIIVAVSVRYISQGIDSGIGRLTKFALATN